MTINACRAGGKQKIRTAQHHCTTGRIAGAWFGGCVCGFNPALPLMMTCFSIAFSGVFCLFVCVVSVSPHTHTLASARQEARRPRQLGGVSRKVRACADRALRARESITGALAGGVRPRPPRGEMRGRKGEPAARERKRERRDGARRGRGATHRTAAAGDPRRPRRERGKARRGRSERVRLVVSPRLRARRAAGVALGAKRPEGRAGRSGAHRG